MHLFVSQQMSSDLCDAEKVVSNKCQVMALVSYHSDSEIQVLHRLQLGRGSSLRTMLRDMMDPYLALLCQSKGSICHITALTHIPLAVTLWLIDGLVWNLLKNGT